MEIYIKNLHQTNLFHSTHEYVRKIEKEKKSFCVGFQLPTEKYHFLSSMQKKKKGAWITSFQVRIRVFSVLLMISDLKEYS